MGLFDLFSNQDAQNAANAKRDYLSLGYNQASDLYGQGRSALSTNAATAAQPFSTLFNQSQQGSSAYADASGANGPEGMARAKAMFTQSPGYSEGINLSLDANDRRAASRGMLNSGNTIADTTKLATDYASQKFGDYRSGLSPYLQQGTSAAQGLGNIYTNLGNQTNQSLTGQGDLAYKTQSGTGDAMAAADLNNYNVNQNAWGALMQGVKLATSAAQGLGNIYTNLGNQTNQSLTGQGDLAYKTQSGTGDAMAAADLNNYNVNQNAWGALMQGVKLATSAATGMPDFSSFGASPGGKGIG